MHVWSPLAGGESGGLAGINVLIAGDEADVLWRTKVLKPCATLPNLCGKRDIDNIARDRDVIRLLRLDVGDDRRERSRVVNETTLFLPVDVARCTFADQLLPVRSRQRCEMRVRKMGEGEHRVARGRVYSGSCSEGRVTLSGLQWLRLRATATNCRSVCRQ